MSDATDNAEVQANAQVESIVAMVAALHVDYDRLEELREEYAGMTEKEIRNWPSAGELSELEEAAGENTSEDEAREAIECDPLSVEIRSGWASSKDEFETEEFRIVLCTGGPHVELTGDIDRGMPSRIRVIYKDWGTRGEYFPENAERAALETYCAQFYFGE